MLHRRRFLQLFGGFAAAAGLGAGRLLAAEDSKLRRVSRTGRALGTEVSLTALHEDAALAERALEAGFAELELIESLMSIYRPESQLSRLNRDRVLSDPHPALLEVLRAAAEISERSGGAFDITVQPLWALFAAEHRAGGTPGNEAIAEARARVDWRRVETSEKQVRLRGAGTQITLNGIAQGFAADRVAQTLSSHGIRHALLDTGELSALGSRAEGGPWRVGIQHPRNEEAYLSLAGLSGRCLATSGDYATTFSEDFSANHLFDPRTGRSPEALASVSIAAPTGLLADALSTAVFVLGPERGFELVRATREVDALLVLKNGKTLATAGFPLES